MASFRVLLLVAVCAIDLALAKIGQLDKGLESSRQRIESFYKRRDCLRVVQYWDDSQDVLQGGHGYGCLSSCKQLPLKVDSGDKIDLVADETAGFMDLGGSRRACCCVMADTTADTTNTNTTTTTTTATTTTSSAKLEPSSSPATNEMDPLAAERKPGYLKRFGKYVSKKLTH